jgi:hypothetical protein
MKLYKFLQIIVFTGIFAISNLVYSHPEKVQAQSSPKAFVVFVNGSGDCCAGSMTEVINRMRRGGNEVWTTSYASFRDGSTTNKVPVVNLSTDLDSSFIADAALVLNRISKSRPIILIGHSYGGDSVLKILPFINRKIQAVVTIDPVGTGGFRQVAIRRKIPSNVDYFMNRWQENGLAGSNIVPFDSRIGGSIPCSAKICDQDAQNLARNSDGSEIRVSCEAHEVSCNGWKLPGCNFSGCWKGSNGTKAKRVFHNDMPGDDFIQRSVSDKIQQQLQAFFSKYSSPYVFDADFYLSSYGDLRNAFGTDRVAAENHWINRGIIEGRQASPNFSTKCYLNRYPDLKNAFGDDYTKALKHYLDIGRDNEKRNGSC